MKLIKKDKYTDIIILDESNGIIVLHNQLYCNIGYNENTNKIINVNPDIGKLITENCLYHENIYITNIEEVIFNHDNINKMYYIKIKIKNL